MQKPIAILALDFDETIAEVNHFPHIVGLRKNAKRYINQLYNEGFFIIINTCRSGEHLVQAIDFLQKEGIKFHLANENHPELITFFKIDCRKISCDIYVDDKDINTILNPIEHEWVNIYQNIHKIVNLSCFKSILSTF